MSADCIPQPVDLAHRRVIDVSVHRSVGPEDLVSVCGAHKQQRAARRIRRAGAYAARRLPVRTGCAPRLATSATRRSRRPGRRGARRPGCSSKRSTCCRDSLQLGNPLIRNAPASRRFRSACHAPRARFDRSHRRSATPGPADRSRPPGRRPRPARCRAREPGTRPAPRRLDTNANAAAPATPPARAPERDADRHTPASLSQPRTRRRSARAPASRCPHARATAANAAAATPPPEAAQARAGPRPPSEHQRGCARRATASGERRGRTRSRARAGIPAADTAPALATASASSTVPRLATAAASHPGCLPDGGGVAWRMASRMVLPAAILAVHFPGRATPRTTCFPRAAIATGGGRPRPIRSARSPSPSPTGSGPFSLPSRPAAFPLAGSGTARALQNSCHVPDSFMPRSCHRGRTPLAVPLQNARRDRGVRRATQYLNPGCLQTLRS